MAEVKFNLENNVLTVFLCGHIDSTNAAEIEAKITAEREKSPSENIVVDAEKLEYISSAGLRILLRIRKDMPDMKIINVSPEVYEILDMTGFTEMITVEKAYRVISVDGCEVIGQGANGKVYRIDRDTIVKVYLNPDSLPDIHRERELARKAFVLGIPTAIPYDVVRVGDGYGSVFELLNAKSFAKIIIEDPNKLDEVIKMSVDLLKKIHGTVVKKGDMPDMKEVVLGWAEFLKDYLPADQYSKLHSLVETVPEDDHMMHGDYHLKNVMLQDGEVLLIDMDTLCMGHPIFELASVFNAYVGFSEIDHSVSMSFLGIPHETAEEIWEKTIRLYLGTDDEDVIKSVKEKAMIVGYTRIMRRTIRRNGLNTPDGQKQIEVCKNHLADLLGRVDSLMF